MIEIIKRHENGIELRATGQITRSDYQAVRPIAESIIREKGWYSALVDITSAEGLSLGAIWEDMKFDVRYFRKTRRIGFVSMSNPTWLWLTSLPFATGGVRFFKMEAMDRARLWTFE